MRRSDMDDPVLTDLAQLPPLVPSAARADRVRARCRRRLARVQHTEQPRPGFGRRIVVPVVVLGLCALYVVSLVSITLQLRSELGWPGL